LLTTGYTVAGVAVGDLNGDGAADLVVANQSDSSVTVFLNQGTGKFQKGQNYTVGHAPTDVVLADFNHEGKLDVATANQSDNTVSVLLGNGDGTFRAQQTYATDTGPSWIATGDFNGDGYVDLVTSNSGDVSVLLNDATWPSTAAYAAEASGRPAAAPEPAELAISLLSVAQARQPALAVSGPAAPSEPKAGANIAPPFSDPARAPLATAIESVFAANKQHQSDADAWALEPWSDVSAALI
jgi:hypothetical protein